MCLKNLIIYLQLAVLAAFVSADCGPRLKYAWGDALLGTECPGPDGSPYPRHLVNRALKSGAWGQSSRQARNLRTVDPAVMRRALLDAHVGYSESASRTQNASRTGRASNLPGLSPINSANSCGSGRLCRTRYNTTAPMYGVSLTSGQPVTIVQKFPDLLQQVVFEVCESSECSVIRGSCTQTYVPYLFLVLPLGPVTLTGQDYVLVESGKAVLKLGKPLEIEFYRPLTTTSYGEMAINQINQVDGKLDLDGKLAQLPYLAQK